MFYASHIQVWQHFMPDEPAHDTLANHQPLMAQDEATEFMGIDEVEAMEWLQGPINDPEHPMRHQDDTEWAKCQAFVPGVEQDERWDGQTTMDWLSKPWNTHVIRTNHRTGHLARWMRGRDKQWSMVLFRHQLWLMEVRDWLTQVHSQAALYLIIDACVEHDHAMARYSRNTHEKFDSFHRLAPEFYAAEERIRTEEWQAAKRRAIKRQLVLEAIHVASYLPAKLRRNNETMIVFSEGHEKRMVADGWCVIARAKRKEVPA